MTDAQVGKYPVVFPILEVGVAGIWCCSLLNSGTGGSYLQKLLRNLTIPVFEKSR